MGIGPLKPGVFLDRDGVLNDAVIRDGKPYPPDSAEEVRIAADASGALQRLKAAGFPLIVVTNQPDVARGKQTAEAVEEIHRAIGRALPVDDFLSCFHDDRDGCACRKPKAGLILEFSNGIRSSISSPSTRAMFRTAACMNRSRISTGSSLTRPSRSTKTRRLR